MSAQNFNATPLEKRQKLFAAIQARNMAEGGAVNIDRQRVISEIRKTPWFREFVKEYGEEPDLSENADYDYVTAWTSGIRPERDPYDNNRYHWSSMTSSGVMLKKPGHPTLWKTYFMEQTGKNPDAIGIKNEQEAQAYINAQRVKKARGGMVDSGEDYTKYNTRILRALIKRYGSEAKAREVMRTTDGGELLQIMREEESKSAYTPSEQDLLRRYASR